jgi:L-ascorbate metabolism protein UlaG (beta-lactamase superfamily)
VARRAVAAIPSSTITITPSPSTHWPLATHASPPRPPIATLQPPASRSMFAPHFDGKHFYNPGAPRPRGFLDVLRWKMTSRAEPSPPFVSDVRTSVPPREVAGREIGITLVNHSTVLLQHHAVNILTDPIWSNRASPLSSVGPHRRRPPGVSFEDLPRIDIVLISHNHYDHLDLPTLHALARRGVSRFVVPLGVGQLLAARGIGPVSELDWGQAVALGDVMIHGVPAVHFSSRGLLDRNRSLWCGYVIVSGDTTLYFAGDTAFDAHFAQIRSQFGPPRLALLPIGAYEPRWFMSAVHMSPQEALEAHNVLEPTTSVAIHHGTFQLADDGIDTPRRQLAASSPPSSFTVLSNGEELVLRD